MYYTVEGGTRKQRKLVDVAMSCVIGLVDIPEETVVAIYIGKFESHGVMRVEEHVYIMEICGRLEGYNILPIELAKTVFHEMKHVEQMSSDRLVYTDSLQAFWEGEDHTDTEYFDCPWEIEAYCFEKSAESMLTLAA